MPRNGTRWAWNFLDLSVSTCLIIIIWQRYLHVQWKPVTAPNAKLLHKQFDLIRFFSYSFRYFYGHSLRLLITITHYGYSLWLLITHYGPTVLQLWHFNDLSTRPLLSRLTNATFDFLSAEFIFSHLRINLIIIDTCSWYHWFFHFWFVHTWNNDGLFIF